MRDSGNVKGIRDLIATRPGRGIRQNLSTDAGLGKNDIRGGDGGQVRDAACSRETSGNAGSRFPRPSQTPDTPHAVRDHETAETRFVGFILRRMHTRKLSYVNRLEGSGNLKAGKQEEEGEKKGWRGADV